MTQDEDPLVSLSLVLPPYNEGILKDRHDAIRHQDNYKVDGTGSSDPHRFDLALLLLLREGSRQVYPSIRRIVVVLVLWNEGHHIILLKCS